MLLLPGMCVNAAWLRNGQLAVQRQARRFALLRQAGLQAINQLSVFTVPTILDQHHRSMLGTAWSSAMQVFRGPA